MKQRLESAFKKILSDDSQYGKELYVLKKVYELRISGDRQPTYFDILYDKDGNMDGSLTPKSVIVALMNLSRGGLITTGTTKFKDCDCEATGYSLSRGVVKIMRSYSDRGAR